MTDTTQTDTTMSDTDITKSIKSKPNKTNKQIIQNAEFDLWSTIKDTQNTNGLRYADYQRYRQYCTRKLHRTRVATKLQLPSKKYTYRKIDGNDITDVKVLTIPLYQAERSWAYSCEIRDELTADNERTKYHMRKRIHKAAQYATQLQQLIDTHCNALSQLHALIYTTWLIGLDYTEMRLYTLALQHFNIALNTANSVKPYSSTNVQSILEEKIQQLNNLIRVCTYNKQQHGDNDSVVQSKYHNYNIDNVEQRIQQLKQSTVNTNDAKTATVGTDTVSFAGKNITITNNIVRDSITQAQQTLQSIKLNNTYNTDSNKTDIDTVKSVIKQYDSALTTTRTDVSATKSDAIKQTLLSLQNYILQQKYEATIVKHTLQLQALTQRYTQQQSLTALTGKHNKKHTKALDVVKLYDKQLNLCKQLAEIATQSKHVDLLQYSSIVQLAYQAIRCYYVAEAYKSNKLYVEASALYDKTLQRIEQVNTQISSTTTQFNEPHGNNIKLLQQQLTTLQTSTSVQQRIVSVLHNTQPINTTTDNSTSTKQQLKHLKQRGILERLHEFDSGDKKSHNIISKLPALQSTPNKPILFDIAYNGIEWPADYSANEPNPQNTNPNQTSEQQKGLLGRLFGR